MNVSVHLFENQSVAQKCFIMEQMDAAETAVC